LQLITLRQDGLAEVLRGISLTPGSHRGDDDRDGD
jgi:hypothetical protein